MDPGKTATFDLIMPEPFDFRLTVVKPAGWHWSTPKETFGDGTLWTGIRLGDRPVGLAMTGTGNRVTVRTYTETALSGTAKAELKSVIRAGLGAGEDLTGFYRFARDDPVLSRVTEDLYGMRVGLLDDIFGSVVLAILLQMAPIDRSERMIAAVLDSFGTALDFAGKEVVLWPRPDDIADLPEEKLRDLGLGYRARRLISAAQYLRGRQISLRDLARLPEKEALEILTGIPGIGVYSAAIIFGEATLPLDAWSVVIMSELFFSRVPEHPRQEIDRVKNSLEQRWGKWSWLAFAYILNDLDTLAPIYHLSRTR